MARDEFISDRLVNMREHLKRNYKKLHSDISGETSGESDEILYEKSVDVQPEKEEISPKTESPVNLRYMPSISKRNGDENVLRRFRELEGKVIHDLTYSESALELLEKRVAELKKFHGVLKVSHETLLKMAEDGDYSKLDELNSGYYSACGRWQAFEGVESADNISKASKSAEKSDSCGSWIISGAIIAGCIIVSAVLLILFA